MPVTGRVIEERKNYYIVDTPEGALRAVTKGTLKKEKKRVCIGDMADCEVTNRDTLEGILVSIHERKTFLKRPPLANIEQIILVATIKEPNLDLEAVDRLLLSIAAYEMTPVIAFNKRDMLSPPELDELQEVVDIFSKVGFQCLVTSALTGEGIPELIDLCSGRLSAFTGQSGVGKSALLAKIFPNHEFVLGEVSAQDGRGTHTTTHSTLIPLAHNGYIADTPGLSFVDLPLVPEEDVATYFPELDRLIGQCRFNNCIHDNEPGCRVRELVESGEIAPWRVEHYLKIFNEMRNRRREYRKE